MSKLLNFPVLSLTWTHWPNISSDPSLQWVTPSHSCEMKAACSPRTE